MSVFKEVILDCCSVAETIDGVDYVNIDHATPTFFTVYGRDANNEDHAICDRDTYSAAVTVAIATACRHGISFIDQVPTEFRK